MPSLRAALPLLVTAVLVAGCAADTPAPTPTTTTPPTTSAPPTTTSVAPTETTTAASTNNTTATSAPTTTTATIPTLNLTKTESTDLLTVDATGGGADWLTIEIFSFNASVAFKLENGSAYNLPLTFWWPASNASNPVEVGNPVKFCRPSGAGEGATIWVRHGPSETVYFKGHFTDLGAC